MKKVAIYITLLVSILCFSAFSVKNTPPIVWKYAHQLKWSDFQADSHHHHSHHHLALSSSSIYMGYKVDGNYVEFKVQSLFFPEESWVMAGKQDHELLNHEQKHFNLTEIYTRKLRQKISTHTFNSHDIEWQAHNLYNEVFDQLDHQQTLYDIETKHATDKKQQRIWDKKINDELNILNHFSNDVVRVPLNDLALRR